MFFLFRPLNTTTADASDNQRSSIGDEALAGSDCYNGLYTTNTLIAHCRYGTKTRTRPVDPAAPRGQGQHEVVCT